VNITFEVKQFQIQTIEIENIFSFVMDTSVHLDTVKRVMVAEFNLDLKTNLKDYSSIIN